MSQHASEISAGKRFTFGKNWTSFLTRLDDDRIGMAVTSLKRMLGVDTLEGLRVLDIGSGSGLFSLSARKLGATVVSFDYDTSSVACTQELKNRYYPEDGPDNSQWDVQEGSVLDRDYLESLGTFDIVYSWGVLHHTGKMWEALQNASDRVAPGGTLFIAIYNDQGLTSRYWTAVKRLYNKNVLSRGAVIAVHTPYLWFGRYAIRAATGRLKLERGMSLWHDMIDWLGGYPFEVARPEVIFDYYLTRGYNLVKLKTCGGRHGCNEFVFRRRPVA